VTPSDEKGPEEISFTDTSDDNDGDLTYCMLIGDTETDSQDVQTPIVVTGDEYDIPSGSDVVTRKHSYGVDSNIPHPATSDSSELQSNDSSTLPKEPITDIAEATEDVNLDSDNPEVPLDFLPKPSPQDYYEDNDFGPIYRFLLKDEF